MHRLDGVDWIRRTFVPILDRLLKPLGLYAENEAHPREYVFSIPSGVEAAEDVLHDIGFLRNGAAGYKTLDPYGVREAGSWAWRYNPGEFGTYRWFGHRQIHLTIFEADGEAHLFVHDELNPWRHPSRHYGGDTFRVEWAKGRVRHVFSEAGVSWKAYPDLDRVFSQA